MKFAAKMTLSTIALLCVTLGVGGAVNLGQNFAQAKETALTAYAAEHERSCFSLETKLARTGGEDLPVSQILAESASWVQGEVGRVSADRGPLTERVGALLQSAGRDPLCRSIGCDRYRRRGRPLSPGKGEGVGCDGDAAAGPLPPALARAGMERCGALCGSGPSAVPV